MIYSLLELSGQDLADRGRGDVAEQLCPDIPPLVQCHLGKPVGVVLFGEVPLDLMLNVLFETVSTDIRGLRDISFIGL